MLILSWNVRFQGLSTRLDGILAAIDAVRPDIVTLQEVGADVAQRVTDGLAALDLQHGCDSKTNAPVGPDGQKKYQCLIASRWPVVLREDGWRRDAPFPELLGRATVSTPDGPLDVFTAHMPNGVGNGWKKIDTFNVLAAALRRGDDAPRILTGDFNEPAQFRRSGQIVTFGEKLHAGGGTSSPAWKDRFGVERAGLEWTLGVCSVLAGATQHGLRDAYRDLHGHETTPVTHLTTRAGKRCIDHTFVSRHFDVLSCEYLHELRERKLSDHSAMSTSLRFRHEQPPLETWEVSAADHDEHGDTDEA